MTKKTWYLLGVFVRLLRRVLAILVALMLALANLTGISAAEPALPPDMDDVVPAAKSAAAESLAPDKRADLLGNGWEKSTDKAVIATGDASGFHVLVANVNDGYQWRTVASLSEPGFDADAWIGNMCVTASGQRAVVVYAPRTFTNKPDLAQRGGFTAIVDLNGGPVRKLSIMTSLAYFNPGCGPTETAVLTQEGTDDLQRTRLLRLDTASGNLAKPIEVPGQLTSPIPVATGIVAADSGAVVRVAADGTRTVLAETKGVPYRLAADADGGVVFAQVDNSKSASVRRVDLPASGRGTVTTIATGAVGDLSVRSARGGQVYVTGKKTPKVRSTPTSIRLADTASGAAVSLDGDIAVTEVLPSNAKDPRIAPADPTAPQPVNITAVSFATRKEFTLSAIPTAGAGLGADPGPALPSPSAAGNPNDPADGDQRRCSVPRNDPRNQAMQPKPRQVEWAVDQAVRGVLTVQRPANWKNLGMAAYTPQGLFPRRTLSSGGYIPAQVMLGIIAQESNMWQAARFAIPGVTANPLIGNYFGIDYYNDDEGDDWTIRWGEADCGYGVGQITDGMVLPADGQPTLEQRAIALDFAANVARAVQLLEDKWNETRAAGLIINNGDDDWIENWFFAVWAYNSGFYPQSQAGLHDGAWGVGWLNNPANPRYPAERAPFLEETYADAAHPQDWPYPEKVMGWAGHPIELIESPDVLVHGFRAAWWVTEEDRRNVKPSIFQFCDASNDCDPDDHIVPNDPDVIGEPAGPCGHKTVDTGLYDLKCWYHAPVAWKVCPDTCGHELLRFDPGYAYQEDGTAYPPNCGRGGMPDNWLFIDDVPASVPSIRPDCSTATGQAGTFQFSFAPDGAGNYPGKIDVHQLGTGFDGHFWMSNTHKSSVRRATGTWTFNQSPGEWGRILVHLPVVGARTQQAEYHIDVGDGIDRKRYVPQEIRKNGWVSLGVYHFLGNPRIQLSNVTEDGAVIDRIAWDAVAVQPLPAKPKHIVAALGDSYTSGEGASNYLTASDVNHGTSQWNACRRSRDAWPRKVTLPGSGGSLGALSDQFDSNHELGFVACSGAQTWNAGGWGRPTSWSQPEKYELGEGQFHEMSQVESGVLDENTTLVMLSIGGNDGGAFANALLDCGDLLDCSNDDDFLPHYKGLVDSAVNNTRELLEDINDRAGNATIILMGYPEIFSRTVKCAGSWYYDMSEVDALAQLIAYMTSKQEALAASLRSEGIPVQAASPVDDFVGHGACDSAEWIHKFRVGANGEGDFHNGDRPSPFCFWDVLGGECLSRESFHPNANGTTGYSTVLRRELDEIGYVGG